MENIDINVGLSDSQVRERVEKGLSNGSGAANTKSVGKIFADNIFTLFNLINVIIAAALAVVGSWRNMLFMGVCLGNIAIGIFEEIRAKVTLDRLKILSAPRAGALRNGAECRIEVAEIVVDDILILKTGDQICADCELCEGEIEANESLLTGESEPMRKEPGDELLSGSFVVSGFCKARVVRAGAESFSGKITNSAKRRRKKPSMMMRDINAILKVVSVCIFPFGVILFSKSFFFAENPLDESITSTAAALIGMIPEGLVLLTSTALALSSIRLARKNTLCQDLYCAEQLARANVLCLDKTGTLTEGSLRLEEIVAFEEGFDAEDALFSFSGAFKNPNATLAAVIEKFGNEKEKKQLEPLSVTEFSSERKFSAARFEGFGTLVFGAGEFVAPSDERVKEAAKIAAAQSRRMLVLAQSADEIRDGRIPENAAVKAVVTFSDKIRSSAPEALEFFKKQGVELKIISGDNPETAANIARQCGFEDYEKFIDISGMSDEELEKAAEEFSIFGRAKPNQKLTLVKALQNAGKTVAMIGDGVNDVPALSQADCSAAPKAGSDAARCAAQLVLMNSDFGSLPAAVNEGRRCINNIERSSSLFLVKTTFSFLLSAIFLFLPYAYPFKPIQLTLISALMIGIPSFLLTLEPNFGIVRGSFTKNVLKRAAPFGIISAALVTAATVICAGAGLSAELSSAVCVYLTAAVSFSVLVKVCVPFNKKRAAMCAVLAAAFVGAALLFGELFYLDVRL